MVLNSNWSFSESVHIPTMNHGCDTKAVRWLKRMEHIFPGNVKVKKVSSEFHHSYELERCTKSLLFLSIENLACE